MGNNVRFIANRYSLDTNQNGATKCINLGAHIEYDEDDIRTCEMINELISQRDSLDPWLLEHSECADIIEYLCLI